MRGKENDLAFHQMTNEALVKWLFIPVLGQMRRRYSDSLEAGRSGALGPTQAPVQWIPGLFSGGRGGSDRGVALYNDHHLAPRLKKG